MKRLIPIALAITAFMASMSLAQPASAQYRNEYGYPDYRDNRHRDQGLVWENSQNLNRGGWQRVTLWVDDPASALFIEVVRGAVELDRAEIVFENGGRQLVDLRNSVYGRGRFAIANFNRMRNVDRVIVTARPRAYGARLGIWRDADGYGYRDRWDNDWRR
jgi:hypothetical protein